MTESSTSSDLRIEILIGGYLLNLTHITQLCLLKYKIPPEAIKHAGVLDCACYYWKQRSGIDAPSLIPITCKDESDPSKLVDAWILPGKVAVFLSGTTPPSLPWSDPDTKKYLDTWFPRRFALLIVVSHTGYRVVIAVLSAPSTIPST